MLFRSPDRNLIGFGKDQGVRDLCAKLARRVLLSHVRVEVSEMICNVKPMIKGVMSSTGRAAVRTTAGLSFSRGCGSGTRSPVGARVASG